MSRLTRDGTAEPNSRDQTLRRERGQGKSYFPCSADHEQDWQPYPVDAQCAESDDHTYTHIHNGSGEKRIGGTEPAIDIVDLIQSDTRCNSKGDNTRGVERRGNGEWDWGDAGESAM